MRTRVRDGDPSAFAELFDRYARAVYNHAFRLTADWSTAEDVMAATYMEAWRLRGKVAPEGGSLRPWLLGIATNTARNQYRSNRRYRATAERAAAAELSVPDHAEEVAARLDGRRRLATALTALASLRRPEREVVVLCLGEGLEYEAAAEALGIPVGTVASRLSRARRKLRRPADDGTESALSQSFTEFRKERMTAQIHQSRVDDSATVTAVRGRRVRLSRPAVVLPALAAVLAGVVVAGVALSGGSRDGGGLVVGPAMTTDVGAATTKGVPQLLDRIALAAAGTEHPVVRPGQYIYIESRRPTAS
ncbi:RNA polymerase, sigma-24 subunit, RpoE, ECF subfamily [Actinobacteria bacterium OK074]|nr:RNA polymerase, sigma-24 subunit, RpoE, ECF subfamily [Actinobacteria bacterium OK074]